MQVFFSHRNSLSEDEMKMVYKMDMQSKFPRFCLIIVLTTESD